jgi:hypothetical protein
MAAWHKAWVFGRSLASDCGFESHPYMDVLPLCVLCVWSGKGLYGGLITRPEESGRVCCILSVISKPQ